MWAALGDLNSPAWSKLERLREALRGMPSVVVAYSGGVDSAFLLSVAVEELGERALAVTAISPSIPEEEAGAARELAASIGARHLEVESREMEDPRYRANPSNRCFFCKAELFVRTAEVADRIGRETGVVPVVLDGTNLDDASDHRPGREAAREAGIRSPLLDARLTKEEIRMLSRERGLPTWDKPAAPCLSSRIPYGIEVTPERLAQVGAAERAVREAGFRSFRVRHHEKVARLEIDPSEFWRMLEPGVRENIARGVKAAGFAFVALDLDGFRSGALNVLAGAVPPLPQDAARMPALSSPAERELAPAAALRTRNPDAE